MYKQKFILQMAEGEGGGGGNTFIETLPAEYREAVQKAGIADLNTLTRNWAEAQSMLGTSIRIPSADAGADAMRAFEAKLMEKVPTLVRFPDESDTEGRTAFMKRLGVPDDPKGYKFDPVDGIPEENRVKLDEWFSSVAHKAGLPAPAAKAVRSEWLETVKASNAQAEQDRKAGEEELRKQWGAGYEQRMLLAKQLFVNTGAEELANAFTPEVLNANPKLAQWLVDRALDYGEDKLVKPGSHSGLPASLRELEAQCAEVLGNKTHPYHDASHPGHRTAVEQQLARMEQIQALKKAVA